ncbi:acyl-CoA N-acyltransferase [Lipomyces kononenkoae]|uniref:Acyl-CoA N-acyltransferase n=1 Tax=Lipomyces kononenkoae TaxID=34357 RepID=A0ACC3SR64_LIPKO
MAVCGEKRNNFGLQVSDIPARRPERKSIEGNFIDLLPLRTEHADELYDVLGGIEQERASLWDYMFAGPFAVRQTLQNYIAQCAESDDPHFFVIVDKMSRQITGYISLLRIDPTNRVIEVGNVMFSTLLQRTRGATECVYLLAQLVFDDLGYRRFEWKCNNLNDPSKRAAQRLGFTFEGIFRQHMIIKGRNRDTAWFSIIDSEWPIVKQAFQAWLDPKNFDEQGRQRQALADLRNNLLRA